MAIISNAVTIADAGAFSASLGSMTLIKTLTASSSSTLSFVHGSASVVLDGTYPIYKFVYTNIHPSHDEKVLTFQGSINGGSGYGVTITSTAFRARHYENDGVAALGYRDGDDLAQATGFQPLNSNTGSDNDECASGTLTLFNPSSTVFVKHFIANGNSYNHNDYTNQNFTAGYANTTSAVNAIQFKMSSGNIGSGQIKLYGLGS